MSKVDKEDVFQYLDERYQVTISELAELFEVHPATIRVRLRQLRKDGKPIIHNRNGLMLISREELENDEVMSKSFEYWMKWLMNVVIGLVRCAKPTQPLLPTLRRSLRESMTAEERRELSLACVRIKGLIDYVEQEYEDERGR